MNLQPAGLPLTQGNAIRALGNLEQAVDASESRLQRANDDVIQRLRSALDQSENNNRLLSDQIARLNTRVTQLEQTRVQLESARQAQHQASEERIRAQNASNDVLKNQFSQQMYDMEINLEVLQRQFQAHIHRVNGLCGNCSGPIVPSVETIRSQVIQEKITSGYKRYSCAQQ
jgi:predicted RNase H-like nuclease (RuvC/YqgF family)